MSTRHVFASSLTNERMFREAFDAMYRAHGRKIRRTPDDSLDQRLGVDVYMSATTRPTPWRVDEKIRLKAYDDCLIETWSIWWKDQARGRANVRGWAAHPGQRTEIVAYAIEPLMVCYLLSYEALREWVGEWSDQQPSEQRADNGSYWTRNVAVPWDVLAGEGLIIDRWIFGQTTQIS